MLDTTVVRGPDVRVNVEQQPHDAADAARLYGELRAKALEDVGRVTVERYGADNEVRVVTCERRDRFEHDEVRVRMLFAVNGVLYDVEVPIDRQVERVAEAIAVAVTQEVVKVLWRRVVR